jgi:hypothetical protein
VTRGDFLPTYGFDTSAFIDPWRRHQPRDIFKSMWKKIDELIDGHEIVACGMVKTELEEKDDELLKYVRSKAGFFVPDDDGQQQCNAKVVRQFPHWIPVNSTKNRADSFVVALGMAHNLTVVTYENNGSASQIKIPFVCKQLGVACLHFIDFLRHISFES